MERKESLGRRVRDRYRSWVARVRGKLKDSGLRDAEDVVQDVLAGVTRLLSFDYSIGDLEAYIGRSIGNRIVDHYRRKESTVSLDEMIDEMQEEGGGGFAHLLQDLRWDVHSELERKQIRDDIEKAVDGLPPLQKAVWIATEIDGLGFEELSLLWNVPLGTLLARKHRAREKLKEKLSGRYGHERQE